jgi:5-methyltetrahydropteroyltriglutamate--homocysteine methyltransferase
MLAVSIGRVSSARLACDFSAALGGKAVTTKRAELEPIDTLRRRIDEAAKYIPLSRLSLSPQCGFSGDMMSDVMSVDQMKRKLELVVQTAHAVWGSA